MKIPRDIDGAQLVKALRALGYAVDRQKGSHIRVTTQQDGENHEVVPNHRPIKTGTLAGILKRIALVIGPGFGGLGAAIRLQARGYATTILEMRNKPGGRGDKFGIQKRMAID